MLATGVEMKVVQETLGHTSSAFTADTYTSVYPQVATAAAEKNRRPALRQGRPGRTGHTHLTEELNSRIRSKIL
jgi:hypothetical protein